MLWKKIWYRPKSWWQLFGTCQTTGFFFPRGLRPEWSLTGEHHTRAPPWMISCCIDQISVVCSWVSSLDSCKQSCSNHRYKSGVPPGLVATQRLQLDDGGLRGDVPVILCKNISELCQLCTVQKVQKPEISAGSILLTRCFTIFE